MIKAKTRRRNGCVHQPLVEFEGPARKADYVECPITSRPRVVRHHFILLGLDVGGDCLSKHDSVTKTKIHAYFAIRS